MCKASATETKEKLPQLIEEDNQGDDSMRANKKTPCVV